MKIRNGFVSNSSSSSFIVSFKTIPNNVTELKKILFGDKKTVFNEVYDHEQSTFELSKIIFHDMQPKNQKKLKEMFDFVADSYFERCERKVYDKYGYDSDVDFPSIIPPETMLKIDQEIKDKIKKYSENKLKWFNNQYPGILFIFEYGNDACFPIRHSKIRSEMEYIDLFNNLPHLKQDNH